MTPRKAVEVITVGVGDDLYRIPLCDAHADACQTDLFGWTRCGTIVNDSSRDIGGTVVASHVHVPVHRVPELTPGAPESPPDFAMVPTPRREPGLPAGHEDWTFSHHALMRRATREIPELDAWWAVLHPDVIRQGNQEGTRVHVRGSVQVVVNPATRTVLTVCRKTNTEEVQQHVGVR
jgi:hypothetical protein